MSWHRESGPYNCYRLTHSHSRGHAPHDGHRLGHRLVFCRGSIGTMFLPWLIGQVFEAIGPQVFPLMLTADLLVPLVAAIALITLSD